MSKFEWQSFIGGYDDFAVSKQKFSLKEAVKIAIRELDLKHSEGYLAVGEAYTRYRFGRNADGEPCSGWWLEYDREKRSCPVFCFHYSKTDNERFKKDYQYINIQDFVNGKIIL